MSITADGTNFTVPGVLTAGAIRTGLVSTAVDYPALPTDSVILVTATGKNVTLPTAIGVAGKIFTVKLTSAGSLTISTTASQTIDGSVNLFLIGKNSYVRVISDGSNWFIIGGGGSTQDVYYGQLY